MHIAPALPDLDLAHSSLVRSTGLHLSEIYNDLFQDLEPERFVRGSPMDTRRLEVGLALELMLEEGLRQRLCAERPEEQMTDDESIAYSPDLLIVNGVTRLGEIKATWMSCRECPISPVQAEETGLEANWDGVSAASFPPKFDKYFVQMKGYCHCLGTPYARLYVFFINGDYNRKRMTPVLLSWDFHFTDQELRENWSMLINHARHKGML